MPCCEPPSTFTAPTSTFTRKTFTAARDPVSSCVQFPPSPNTRVCCAIARGKVSSRTATSLEIFFNFFPSFSCIHRRTGASEAARPHTYLSIELRELGQYDSRLRLDVLVLIVLRQFLQDRTHAAVGADRFQQM